MGEFQAFGAKALPFFKALAFHQNKQWYDENRSLYEEHVRAPLSALLRDVAAQLARKKINLSGDPKKVIFRLNRDVRFSNDKSPYKTHAGAALYRNGDKKDGNGLVYIHISPQECFLAAGFYHPEPAYLKAIRQSIIGRPERYRALVKTLARKKLALSQEDALTRLPRDFKDVEEPDLIEALKLKSFIIRAPLAKAELKSPDLVKRVVDFALAAEPLIVWGRREDIGP